MKQSLHVCYVTGSRSEYDRLFWLLKDLQADKSIKLSLIVTGMHLSKKHGSTIDVIKRDGFQIATSIDMLTGADDALTLAKDVSRAGEGIAQALAKIKPDVVLLYGDRYELLTVANSCVILGLPIAHIGGGHVTEGAIDNQVRMMLTKAAHLHYVANDLFAKRLMAMGEEKWRVAVTGSPALDCMRRVKLLSRQELSQALDHTFNDLTALVTFHPVTLDLKNLDTQINGLIDALIKAHQDFGLNYVVTYPNADAGNQRIIKYWKRFEKEAQGYVVSSASLGQIKYLSVLKQARMMIGNSSSGIVEAPTYNVPVVNIGNRQHGRMMASNIIQSSYKAQDIYQSIKRALNGKHKKSVNPYGDGKASLKIISHLKKHFSRLSSEEILIKKWVD